MISSSNENIGKEFMYILPIREQGKENIIDYMIAIVEIVKNSSEAVSIIKVKKVIREELGNGIYTYLEKIGDTTGASNCYLYPITNKFRN